MGYHVWRLGGAMYEIDDPSASSWTDEGLSAEASFTYQVSTFTNADGDLATSNSATATTGPAVPTGLSATAVSANETDLGWSARRGRRMSAAT